MGIKITAPVEGPVVVYDQVFLLRLVVEQVLSTDAVPPPKYKIFIEYRRYGVVNGVRHFHPEVREVVIEDFVTAAMKLAATGDNSLIQSLPAIETAIAALVAADLNTQARVV